MYRNNPPFIISFFVVTVIQKLDYKRSIVINEIYNYETRFLRGRYRGRVSTRLKRSHQRVPARKENRNLIVLSEGESSGIYFFRQISPRIILEWFFHIRLGEKEN